MTDRDKILNSLPTDSGGVLSDFPHRNTAADWKLFESKLAELGGELITVEEANELCAGPTYVDQDAQEVLNLRAGVTGSVWQAEVGVCLADLAIAETGSLVIISSPGRDRLTSLAPPVNIVFVRNLVGSLAEALGQIGTSNAVIISGTSRTADIEGILVRGVHGPRDLYVVRLQ